MDESVFVEKAKGLVTEEIYKDLQETIETTKSGEYLSNELNYEEILVYVVWQVKVLHHNKCLISTDVVHGYYWEITYNGIKDEIYVDRYIKENNKRVKPYDC